MWLRKLRSDISFASSGRIMDVGWSPKTHTGVCQNIWCHNSGNYSTITYNPTPIHSNFIFLPCIKFWQKGSGEDDIARSFKILYCSVNIIRVIKKGEAGRGMWHAWATREVHRGVWWGHLREGDHLGDLGINGRTVLKLIFMKWVGRD
jgi:predicted CxxxxCH...CXXCH cytochrome family protein